MKKFAVVIFVVLLLGALLAGAAACSGTELESGYSDVVEEFYGDGMSYISSYAAPAGAVQFKDKPRVDKKIVIDNRISGSHITGLYLPAGESVTVTVPSSVVTHESSVAVIDGEGRETERVMLMHEENVLTSQKGGILLYYIGGAGVSERLSPTEIYFSGAMPAPFYRYGLDSSDDPGDLSAYGDMLVPLDCGNLRFYLPASLLDGVSGLKQALEWWRSAAGVAAQALSATREDGNMQPLKVYFTAQGNAETDVLFASNGVKDMLSASELGSTSAGLALLERAGERFAGERADAELLGRLAAYNAYMLLKDSFVIYDESSAAERDELYFSNGYAVLQRVMAGESLDKKADVMLCLMHSGGTGASAVFLDMLTAGVTADEIVRAAGEAFGVNAAAFAEKELGESVSAQVKEKVKDLPAYRPVFNYYTRSVKDENRQNGYKVYAGDTHKVDFAGKTLVYGGEVKSVTLEGSNGWQQRDDGYYYTALSENVRDGYTLTVTAAADGKEFEYISFGDISLNVNAASYRLYTDIPVEKAEDGTLTAEAIDKAVDIHEEYSPAYSLSLAEANCGSNAYGGERVSSNIYTFSVTSFNFEVEEDGMYTFSMANTDTGFCYYRVDFGVGDYEYTMFGNYVPVQQPGLLSRTEELKAGYVYRFDMYLLQPGVSNGLTLYVAKDGGEYQPVGAEYMSFPGTSKAEQMEYTAPAISLQGSAYPDTLYMKEDASAWTGVRGEGVTAVSGEPDAVCDGDLSSVYVLSAQTGGNYTLNFNAELPLDYIKIFAAASGVTYAAEVYDGEWHRLAEGLNGDAELFCEGSFSALRLAVSGSGTLEIREIEGGEAITNCTYVPHTSSDIWYEGSWLRMTGGVSVNGSVAQNNGGRAYAEYNFYGDEVAIMATIGPQYGGGTVYIDGKKYGEISLFGEEVSYQTVVFYAQLENTGEHTVRLEAARGEKVNIDAIVYSEGEYDPTGAAMPFNPYYLLILAAIVVIGVVVCAILDHRNRHKKARGGKKEKSKKEAPPAEESAPESAESE